MNNSQTRVAVISSVHKPKSTRIFYRQCRSLAEARYQVTYIVPTDLERDERDGVTIIGVPKAQSRWERPLVWWHLAQQIRQLQPHIVHLHDPELLLLATVLKLTFGRRMQFIYDVHEYLVDSVREKIWLPSWLRPAAARMVQWAEQLLARSVSGLVLVIEDQLSLYKGLDRPKVVVHNYPAAADFADPERPPEYQANQFRLVYIGSLFERRGVWTMLEAFRLVAQRIPEAHLFLGGSYEDPAFERRVRRFVATHDLPVTLLGWVPFAQVKNYLTYAHCAWMPGRLTAQFSHRALSTKIFEAMICGTPIVSADLPHRREFIAPAKAGLLVAPEDPAAHAEAVHWLYHHPQERRAMGARGQTWVSQKYVWEQEREILLRFYERLLDEGQGK